MIQSLLDVAGSPGLASFIAVVIAHVWCTQGLPRRIRAAKKRKKPSKTGLGWFTTFRRKEAPAGFEPAMADLQSQLGCLWPVYSCLNPQMATFITLSDGCFWHHFGCR